MTELIRYRFSTPNYRLAILLFMLILSIFYSTVFGLSNRPVVVLSIIKCNEGNYLLYPQISVSKNGKFYKADIKDLWVGQKFLLFPYEYKVKNPLNTNPDILGTVALINGLPVNIKLNSTKMANANTSCWGIYSSHEKFSLSNNGPKLSPKKISIKTNNQFFRLINTDAKLKNVINYDWINIKRDFKNKFSSNIIEYMMGDINGDGNKDYIIVLGNKGFGNQGSKGIALIIYLKNGKMYERIAVESWENTSDYYSWPKLLFTMDLNGDNAEELFIALSDSDTDIPVIYSWLNNRLVKVYEGENEIWH